MFSLNKRLLREESEHRIRVASEIFTLFEVTDVQFAAANIAVSDGLTYSSV